MQKWGPFARYDNPDLPGIISLKEPGGQDFYALRNSLATADAVDGAPQNSYLLADEASKVTLATNDVGLTFPFEMTLYQVPRLVDPGVAVGQVVAADGTLSAAAPVVPSAASKLGLVRALREKGDWATVKAALAKDDTLQDDWDAAQTVARADPLTQAMIETMHYTVADVDALLIRAAALAST